ncbi:hypothetical protein AB0J83_39880 [Actinoplanes sp. NPDC049596]|uniref:hypothetical protein n=1 Tax=unclassified Actinoplanes TaxID=2626549 RepID=UPI003425ED89
MALVPWPGTRAYLRHVIGTSPVQERETSLKLAAACGAAGDHAEQILVLRDLAERGDAEAYQLLLAVLTDQGRTADIVRLRQALADGRLHRGSPLFSPWPGIDGPGLLRAAQQLRHSDPANTSVLTGLANVLDEAGTPDPSVWRELIDRRQAGYHVRLARHLAAEGRLDEATELMRVGPDGDFPQFPEAAVFLREQDLLERLEEEAWTAWRRGHRDQHALRELRQLLTDQDRLDELAELPEPSPQPSAGHPPQDRWPGFTPATLPSSYDSTSAASFTNYSGYSGC